MSVFSTFVLPTCSNYISSDTANSTVAHEWSSAFGLFLIWPTLILLFEMLCGIKSTAVWYVAVELPGSPA